MTQKIIFEATEGHTFSAGELSSIVELADRFSHKDLRVNTDPTNLKVYVGLHNKETHRYWLDKDTGFLGLIEEDKSSDTIESDWQPTSYVAARKALSK